MDGAGLCLEGGLRLGPEGLAPGSVTIRSGRFSECVDSAGRRVRVDGLWLLPGVVDLHGDGFERHLAPRRGVVTDLGRGLDAVEAELAVNGIATSWLAQFWSWEGGMRGPDFARRFAAALDDSQARRRLDMRMQLRLESHMVDDDADVRALIARHRIGYVVINDHLPHRYLAAGHKPPRLTGGALKAGRSPEAHLAEMRRRAACAPQVPGFVTALCRDLMQDGVKLGVHDETDAAARTRHGTMGLKISEFPTTRAAAEAARDRGSPVVMGAPNVVRGGSHDKRVAAEALVADGLVDALASDYHYPSLVAAAFALADRGTLPFAQAWALISRRPAEVMGLTDRGRIAQGARADLVLLDPVSRRILGTFSAGRPAYLSGVLADAVLS